jgi:thymidylate synthase (FAD)
MNITKQKVTLIDLEQDNIKKCELAGRNCYKSESGISNDSYKMFLKNIVKLGHWSIFESTYISFLGTLDKETVINLSDFKYHIYIKEIAKGNCLIFGNIRSFLNLIKDYTLLGDKRKFTASIIKAIQIILKEKYPFLFEEKYLEDFKDISLLTDLYELSLKELQSLFTDKEIKENCQIFSFYIDCNRYIQQQITRHRSLSFAVESMRYCNYSKDKFGKSVKFIIPEEMPLTEIESFLTESENTYFSLLEKGFKPEIARGVLPLYTASTMFVTGKLKDWNSFIELRDDTHAQGEAQIIAKEIKKLIS